MALMAGMQKEAGTCCRSRSARIRGRPVVAPYSPSDRGTGSGRSLQSASLSTSKDKHTATSEPFGHCLGVSFRPTRTFATACWICASVASIPIAETTPDACDCDASRRLGDVRVQAASPKNASTEATAAAEQLLLL